MSPRWGSTLRQTDWLTVSCKVTLTWQVLCVFLYTMYFQGPVVEITLDTSLLYVISKDFVLRTPDLYIS
jgi:hypothetical protein